MATNLVLSSTPIILTELVLSAPEGKDFNVKCLSSSKSNSTLLDCSLITKSVPVNKELK